MRVIIRRELPHPGATLDAFEIRDGYRYQAFSTNTPRGQLAFLEARHRAHARVKDRIRTGKNTGLGHLPSPSPEHQRSLDRTRPDRRGPARPDPDDAAYRSARVAPRRTQDPPVSAPAHRRAHHPRPAQSLPTPSRTLALGTGPRQSIHPPAADPAPGPTASATASPHQPTKITETPDQRRRSLLPRYRSNLLKVI